MTAQALETGQKPWRGDRGKGSKAAKRNAFRGLGCAQELNVCFMIFLLSIRTQPANNRERGPSRLVSMTGHHAFENLATNLGTRLRGIKRCAKTLNLLSAPGTVRPPPLARTWSASSTTSSGL
jgi:hypothetical protein